MSVEESKAKVRAFYEEAMTKGNLSVIDDLVAPVQIAHGSNAEPGQITPEDVKQFVTDFRAAAPGLKITINAIIAEGDKVVDFATATYTHTIEINDPVLGRIPPTGRQITSTWISINRFVDGRSVENWLMADDLGYWKQLGFTLTRAPAEK